MIRLKLVRVFQSGVVGPIRIYKRARPADAPKPLGDRGDIPQLSADRLLDRSVDRVIDRPDGSLAVSTGTDEPVRRSTGQPIPNE